MAGNYGFTISVQGDAVKKINDIKNAVKQMGAQVSDTTEKMKSDMNDVGETIKRVGETIAAAFAVEKVIEFGREVLNITAEFQGFDNVIKYSSLNAIDAQENLSFLKGTIQDLHLPMEQAYKGFSEMQAGLQGTGIEGEKLRNFFKGFSTMALVQHLDPARYDRALYDLKEIGEIGLNKRMERSLMINLTGIGKVVKETFGKTMHELQEEGMGGAEFLDKLGTGMQKAFAPGKENAINSLQAQMASTSNAFTQAMLDMGKNLEPVFLNIMHAIQGAFNSAPVQWFIKNIKDLTTTVGFAIEAWAIYKGILFATDLVEKVIVTDGKILTVTIGGITTMIEGSTVAVEGLETALSGLGIGLLALGIAGMINEFVTWNNQLETAADKISHISELRRQMKDDDEGYSQMITNMQELPGMSKEERGELYSENAQKLKSWNKQLADAQIHMADAAAVIAKAKDKVVYTTGGMYGGGGKMTVESGATQVQRDQFAESLKLIQQLKNKVGMAMYAQNTLDKLGVKPATPTVTGNSAGSDSLTDLSGAKGGLSDAKKIYITINGGLQHIDKVEGGSDWRQKSDDAGKQLMRVINNISLSQSSSF